MSKLKGGGNTIELQFGHSLTAVENTSPIANWPAGVWALQFGHSLTAVENRGRSSLSPWYCQGFNLATALQPWRTKRNLRRFRRPTQRLQFGHSLTAVENYRELQAIVSAFMLQFGHSLTAVENS